VHTKQQALLLVWAVRPSGCAGWIPFRHFCVAFPALQQVGWPAAL